MVKLKKTQEEVVAPSVETPTSTPVVSQRDSLLTQLGELNALRTDMNRLGVDSVSKLDVLAGQLNAEIAKL